MRLIVTINLVASIVATAGFEQRVSAPADDFLLQITQRAARDSRLGDLQTAKLEGTDIELRFWAGYGLVGTHGLRLRRHAGVWTTDLADLEDCRVIVPFSKAGNLTDAQLEQLALKKCDSDPPLPKEGENVFTAWRLRVRPTRLGGDLNSLWSDLMSSGLAELPPRVPREWVMLDGHSFVVEFRTADEYRASVIECTKPEVLADTQVQRIGALLYKRLPIASWLQCGHQ